MIRQELQYSDAVPGYVPSSSRPLSSSQLNQVHDVNKSSKVLVNSSIASISPTMSFARSAFGALRSARLSIGGARAQLVRHSARRGYSSGHGPEASSDLPWAAGAVAVTVPACWYLLKESPAEAHHLHVPHKVEAHAEPEAEAEEEPKEEPKEETEEEAKEETKEETKEEPKEEAKEETKEETKEEKPSADASKSEDEAKDTTENSEKPTTDAKHSTDAGEGSGNSEKAEGTPETSKSKDTVDSSKPAK
ncbi:hypothetical protein V495_02730 [Pseudogymnoascus sp. VKM F-4514 (FW-929)]|nr:hypothetical protein V495_02730 [Pseudogymnoascus sp. VKM F-4514 (FW-929)]KFY62698.1 hypothetical protein V497_02266 [Pseudogymnoascus sp. VKM F-4516 (FW-969)]